ncbi:benzoate/H(+) symporter BenE family transporter [Lysobacter capsici]|uniref:benzoate/H(+) symporter BenE family transporter n=1 Tax=Lysobacter capsici TaxID=435897 RepID=UPI00287BB599|nr:benzoate/H(+) symporter BenE family transporter [Lysobacter capsici]WND83020.1 benzoate/H(+) symporter BenE family transporter [Lysobacter capsici]WND88219.1 benzoate/H(+) symporter BenE family transporter [Lysobacter capsici]
MRLLRDLSLSAVIAGFVAVLVGFTSSAAIVFSAAQASGASDAEIASWMWALGLGMGATCIGLSLRYRVPVVTAWSTPGAAMLITGAAGLPLAEIVGAFVVSAVLTTALGFSGWLERALSRLPTSLASGMLAGVLLRFGLNVFTSMQAQFALVFAMFLGWLLARRWSPRYAVVITLAIGVAIAAVQGQLHLGDVRLTLAQPIWITPKFSLAAVIGVAIPLFVVTMASQNIPGIAILRAHGYQDTPVSPLIGWTGLVTLVLAPFGAFALNLAAITAAICMGSDAHEDSRRRYVAAVAAGVFYLLTGLFGATVAALFAAFPKELVLAIAGIALLTTIGNGLAAAVHDPQEREPALITFLVTASGVSAFQIGSVFWGMVAGLLALAITRRRHPA